jgi:type 1 glutamine amidotransferase
MRTTTNCVACIAAIALIASACGQSSLSADDLNDKGTSGTGGTGATAGAGMTMGGTSAATGGSIATGGAAPSGGAGGAGATGGAAPLGGTAGEGTTGGAAPLGGSGGAGPTGGSAGSGMETGGSAGVGMAGTAGSGGGTGPIGPYDPRSGSFKMLVYSQTLVFRHNESITTGKTMVQQIAQERGFEIKLTENTQDITAQALAEYEVVFFLNPTGEIFSATERAVFEEWITTRNGGFVGVHSATDTAQGWSFYKELTGQYYNLHEICCSQQNIQWDQAALNHPTVRGLPSPWTRSEEWYNFDSNASWSAKPGFLILSRVTVANKTRPVSYVREFGNFRSFYTSLGHEGVVFQDANVKKHVTAGIMWAARREHLLPQ